MNVFQLFRTDHSKVLTLRQLKTVKLQSEKIQVDGLAEYWEILGGDKAKVILQDRKNEDGTHHLYSLDLNKRSVKEEATIGVCDRCGSPHILFDAVTRGDYIVESLRCKKFDCKPFFIKIWRNGNSLGQFSTDSKDCFNYSIRHDSQFLIFRTGKRSFTRISWQSIENRDLTWAETIDLETDDEGFDFDYFGIDGDKIVMGSYSGALYLVNLARDRMVIPFPAIFPQEEVIRCIVVIKKKIT